MSISINISRKLAPPPSPPYSPSPSLSSSRSSVYSLSPDPVEPLSIYKGISDRPRGWKPRRPSSANVGQVARDAQIKKWDGAARRSTEWDGLRKDPDLWYSNGDCYVHLYAPGTSQRGPSFRIPYTNLVEARCLPLLERYRVQMDIESPSSCTSGASSQDRGYFGQPTRKHRCDLYIPAPAHVERAQAMMQHIATRNFFAYLCGKSMVGPHLGGALVDLLHSMAEFRSKGADNVEDLLAYMDEEGYADMRTQPDHALAVLYFAEYFHFDDLWIDAFTHCTGMNDIIAASTEFEHISRVSCSLIKRARCEMDARLARCARSLSSFLDDELSPAHLGLSNVARSELDRFRSFLQAYYVAKLGYYPPSNTKDNMATFPKPIFATMAADFQKLYDYLVDADDYEPTPAQGGICVLQNLNAFNERHRYAPLPHAYPRLPEPTPTENTRFGLFSLMRQDKMKLDSRLITLSTLYRASNQQQQSLLDNSLVRAFRGYEKSAAFSKHGPNCLPDAISARKIRWILIYTTLQTLRSATVVPAQLTDTHNVPYHLCVLTAGCPPWNNPFSSAAKSKFRSEPLTPPPRADSAPPILKPDIDYLAQRDHAASPPPLSPRSTQTNLLLQHPTPLRNSLHHEIVIQGYGNGTGTGDANRNSSSTTDTSCRSHFSRSSSTDTRVSTPDVDGDMGKKDMVLEHTYAELNKRAQRDWQIQTPTQNQTQNVKHRDTQSYRNSPPAPQDAESSHDHHIQESTKHPFRIRASLEAWARSANALYGDDGWGSAANNVPRVRPLALPVRNPGSKVAIPVDGKGAMKKDSVFDNTGENAELLAYLRS